MSDSQSTLGINRIETTTRDQASTTPSSDTSRSIGRRRNDRIISASPQMQKVVDQASGIARSDDPVVLSGPSGSGRKHVARAIHQWSVRAGGPLIEVQIAQTSEAVQLRELFGDGTPAMPGALARAANGSLLLEGAEQLSSNILSRLRDGTGERARILATISQAADGSSNLLTSLRFWI